jgi:iron complex transport system permease protein
VPIAAFVGAVGATFLVYGLSVRGGQVPVALLLLTGVAVGALTTALVSLMMVMGDEDLRTMMFWLMGSLSSRGWAHVRMVAPYMVVGLAVIYVFARDLNVLLLGEETATHLGVEVERVKRVLLIASALLAASAVAAGGIIGFVGLIVPHVTRMIVGPDHRRLIAASALSGGMLLILSDVVARTVAAPGEVPIGIITAVIGCPFFLFLLARKKETGW